MTSLKSRFYQPVHTDRQLRNRSAWPHGALQSQQEHDPIKVPHQSGWQSISQHDIDLASKQAFSSESEVIPTPEIAQWQSHAKLDAPSHSHSHPRLWQPIWLKKFTLFALAALFAALSIGLIILWRVIEMHDGLKLTLTHNDYAWRYGPTVILVFVVGLWRQVDYHCKSLSPWQNLKSGPASASKTVLLDYVSTFQLKALFKAIRLRNFAVAISVTGFGLLKLSLIFSTGLLISNPTFFNDAAVQAVITTKFDALTWNASQLTEVAFNPPATTFYNIPNSSLAYTYYGIVAKGLSISEGAYNGTTFQSFRPIDDGDKNITGITTTVDIFRPNTKCEIANIVIKDSSASVEDEPTTSGVEIQADSPTCHMGHGNPLIINRKDYTSDPCDQQELTPEMKWASCTGAALGNNTGFSQYDASVGDFRWLMTLSNVSYIQTNSSNGTVTGCFRSVHQIVGIVCQVQYEMIRLPVSYTLGLGRPEVEIDLKNATSSSKQLTGMTNTQLNQAIMHSLAGAGGLFPMQRVTEDTGLDLRDGRDAVFGFLELQAGGNGSYQPLLSAPTLQNTAESLFNGISNLHAHQALLTSDSTPVDASSTYAENRLHIRSLSLWFMVALFLIMMILSLLLVAIRPYRVVPCNPNSLASSAAILHASDITFQRALLDMGYGRQSYLRHRLDDYMFQSTVTDKFAVAASDRQVIDKSYKKTGPWYPWSIRLPLLIPTILVPVIAIASLEILQRVSDKNPGIATVVPGDKTKENAFYYLTTLVLLLIATTYNNLDFVVAVFTPLSALHAESLPPKRGILLHLIDQVPVVALWRSIKARHFGASLSNIAALVGSTLTIVGSGLWLLDHNALLSDHVQMQRLDTWNTAWNGVLNDTATGIVINLMRHQNLSYPQWTFDELALPQVDVSSRNAPANDSKDGTIKSHKIDGIRTYELALPALRANLNCTLATVEAVAGTRGQNVSINYPLPPECRGGAVRGKNSSIWNLQAGNDQAGDTTTGYYSAFIVNWPSVYTSSNRTSNASAPADPGCPSLGFFLAYYGAGTLSPDNVTAVICFQEMQEVTTTLRLSQEVSAGIAGSPILDDTSPPTVDENSVHRLTNGSATAFSWQVADGLSATQTLYPTTPGNDSLNEFFINIFSTSGNYTANDIERYMHPSNAGEFTQAINHAYRRYMAQLFGANMRVPTNTSLNLNNNADLSPTFDALRSTQTPRMIVNRTAKFALQGEFAVMVLLTIAAFFMIRIRGTMAHNPCSIAGTMTLLAGSEMVERIPSGLETVSNRERTKIMTEGGGLYSLGWWNMDVNGRQAGSEARRFGVDVGRAEPY